MSLLRAGQTLEEEKRAIIKTNLQRAKEFSKNVKAFNDKHIPGVLNLLQSPLQIYKSEPVRCASSKSRAGYLSPDRDRPQKLEKYFNQSPTGINELHDRDFDGGLNESRESFHSHTAIIDTNNNDDDGSVMSLFSNAGLNKYLGLSGKNNNRKKANKRLIFANTSLMETVSPFVSAPNSSLELPQTEELQKNTLAGVKCSHQLSLTFLKGTKPKSLVGKEEKSASKLSMKHIADEIEPPETRSDVKFSNPKPHVSRKVGKSKSLVIEKEESVNKLMHKQVNNVRTLSKSSPMEVKGLYESLRSLQAESKDLQKEKRVYLPFPNIETNQIEKKTKIVTFRSVTVAILLVFLLSVLPRTIGKLLPGSVTTTGFSYFNFLNLGDRRTFSEKEQGSIAPERVSIDYEFRDSDGKQEDKSKTSSIVERLETELQYKHPIQTETTKKQSQSQKLVTSDPRSSKTEVNKSLQNLNTKVKQAKSLMNEIKVFFSEIPSKVDEFKDDESKRSLNIARVDTLLPTLKAESQHFQGSSASVKHAKPSVEHIMVAITQKSESKCSSDSKERQRGSFVNKVIKIFEHVFPSISRKRVSLISKPHSSEAKANELQFDDSGKEYLQPSSIEAKVFVRSEAKESQPRILISTSKINATMLSKSEVYQHQLNLKSETNQTGIPMTKTTKHPLNASDIETYHIVKDEEYSSDSAGLSFSNHGPLSSFFKKIIYSFNVLPRIISQIKMRSIASFQIIFNSRKKIFSIVLLGISTLFIADFDVVCVLLKLFPFVKYS